MDFKKIINCPEEPMPLLDAIISFRMGDGSQIMLEDFDDDRGGSVAANNYVRIPRYE